LNEAEIDLSLAKAVEELGQALRVFKFDRDNENVTILNYQELLVQERDLQIDLATALGEDVPDVSRQRKHKG
jgi:hypothetical protein